MATVVSDLVQQAEVTDGPDGLTAVRMFMVSDLGGDVVSRVGRALLAEGIPRRGQPHPGITYLYVTDRRASLNNNDTDSVLVTINYKSPSQSRGEANSGWSIQTGAAVQEVETNFLAELDNSGKRKPIPPIKYKWQAKDGKDKPVGTVTEGTGIVRVYEPVLTWTMTRREKDNPMEKSLRYTGKVNKTTWNGKPARTWLCMRVGGGSDDGGKTYTVNYEFLYRADGWTKDLVFVDSATGQPPPGIDTPKGNGILRGQKVYFEEDFGPLDLTGSPNKSAFTGGFTGL